MSLTCFLLPASSGLPSCFVKLKAGQPVIPLPKLMFSPPHLVFSKTRWGKHVFVEGRGTGGLEQSHNPSHRIPRHYRPNSAERLHLAFSSASSLLGSGISSIKHLSNGDFRGTRPNACCNQQGPSQYPNTVSIGESCGEGEAGEPPALLLRPALVGRGGQVVTPFL